ncbi:MAG: type II secretion system protein [Phycisphaerales bacterium JB063]
MSPTLPRARRGRHAFTLIELLVVIGLIGVLIAILSVALRGAKENARATKCSNHLRQIGVATNAYTTDNHGYLPYEDRGDEAMTPSRICWVDSLQQGQYLEIGETDESILACPSVTGSVPIAGADPVIESYRMNSKLAETNPLDPDYTGSPHRMISQILNPARTVVYFDGDVGGDAISFKGRWRDGDDDVAYRHNTSTVITFGDWHVERVTKKDLDNDSAGNDQVIWQLVGQWDPSP